MAAKPAAKALCKVDTNSTVRLSIGDNITDQAEIHLNFQISPNRKDTKSRFSSSMVMRVDLPEGIVSKDPSGAMTMARKEAANLLRKMATAVQKG